MAQQRNPVKKPVKSPDTVYAERYNEMRRYRDYELTAATWYTAILLGVLGLIVTAKFGDIGTTSLLAKSLSSSTTIQFLVAGAITLIGGGSFYSVRYVHFRYNELWNHTRATMETSWSKFTPAEMNIRPRHIIYMTHIIIIGASNFLIFAPPCQAGIVVSLAAIGLICLVTFVFVRPAPLAK